MHTYTAAWAPDRPGRAALADISSPTATASTGAVLVVHGGGFVGGWRSMPAVRRINQAVVDGGRVAIAPDYRVLFRGGRFDEAVEDVLACWSWWCEQADVPPSQVDVVGISAGAALVAAAASQRDPRTLSLIYGPHDFELLPRWAARALLRTSDPDVIRARSPANTCRTPAPTLVVHGHLDAIAPIGHSQALVRMRQAHKLPTKFLEIDGVGHGFLNWAGHWASDLLTDELARFLDAEH
jgi:acetyl esterase/lipase